MELSSDNLAARLWRELTRAPHDKHHEWRTDSCLIQIQLVELLNKELFKWHQPRLVLFSAFITWLTFRHYQMLNPLRSGVDYLRAPDRSSRCDEYTDEERERLTTRR